MITCYEGVISLTRVDLELNADQLRKTCDVKLLSFKDTSEIESLDGVVGQDRAIKALEFGLDIPYQGYNLFLCGPPGTGKTTLARDMAQKRAATRKVPLDWCYVYNFLEPDHPQAIRLPGGTGKKLVRDIDGMINKVKQVLAKVFNGQDFELGKNQILAEFYDETNKLYANAEQAAKKQGFTITRNQNGFASVPLKDGHPITPEEFEGLDETDKIQMMERGRMIQEFINEGIRQYKELERGIKERLRLLEQETARGAIAPLFCVLFDHYRSLRQIVLYLEEMQRDIIENLELFVEQEETQNPLILFKRLDKRHALRRYKVNLVIDNSDRTEAPVIVETNPTFANLFGTIEYEGEFGVLSTDFTKIRGGAIHRANGGYLILNFIDLIRNYMVWETLKRVLKNQEAAIESIYKTLSMGGAETLQPEPIPIELKVIIIGEPFVYYLLRTHDEDFSKLFKIKVEFDTEMARESAHIMDYSSFISTTCRRDNLPHFSNQAVARVVDYGTWLADDQRKLSITFNRVRDIILESATWASYNQHQLVEAEDVEQAIREKVYRSNMLEDKIMETIKDGTIMIEVTGERVGEINGLAVYSIGDHMFGKPSRITAKTFMGEKGVVNIEREVRMSGSIHTKGVLTLGGYLGGQYAQDKPLSLSASVTFEQTYQGVEGDSASSAELYAIISSLAGVPIKQGIAVTGSVNQNGEIQPIGGVNQKISGYFRVCTIKGLNGEQGVIIPRRNIENLMLDEEIVEKVRKGQFHIWAIDNVDQGIEILMDMEAGVQEPHGDFTRDSVHYLVNRRLREWGEPRRREKSRRINHGSGRSHFRRLT